MIRATNIFKSYGTVEVLRGVDVEIPTGKVTAIVGPSGAGKTTLLQIIGTLTKPDSGSLTYDDRNPLAMNDRQLSRFRNRHIGFVFQNHRLLPEFTLLENVAMPALIGGESKEQATAKAKELIERLGLTDRSGHRPGELSGGECQRAAVARALINRPNVVLADEPTGSLDSENRQILHRMFFELRDQIGATFAIVTHDEDLASDCDKIIHLSR